MNMGHHCSVSIPAEIPAVRLGEPKTAEPDSIFMELFLIPGTPPILKSILAYERADKRLTEARGYLEDAKDFKIEIAKEKARMDRKDGEFNINDKRKIVIKVVIKYRIKNFFLKPFKKV